MTQSRASVRPWYAHTLSSPAGLAALLFLIALLVIAAIAPMVWGAQAQEVDVPQARLLPSLEHPMGTDELGRDIFLRVLVGSRATLFYTLGAVAISAGLGIGMGLLAAVLGRRGRQLMYQIAATATAFPAILLAVLLATLFGRSGVAAMLGLAVAGAPIFARLTMNLAISAAGSESVYAARTVGVRGTRLLGRYIFPNVAEPIATLVIMTSASYLLALSALSFVGLGVQNPEWDWGAMLSGALTNIYSAPTMIIGPGLAIVLTGISFNVLGESLASGIDPRNRIYATKRQKPLREAGAPDAASSGAAIAVPVEVAHDEAIGISGLNVFAGSSEGELHLVKNLSLSVRTGERVAIVGESGSGKSLTVSALAHLLPGGVRAESRSQRFFQEEIGDLSAEARRLMLGDGLSMVFQDPMSTLNPALKVKSIMLDKLSPEQRKDKKAAKKLLLRALEDVGIADAEQKLERHPHELSGGQRQRVMIAIALLGNTRVMLADEPTTALDVSVQAQIVDLLRRVSCEQNMSLVLVSHDLALVSQLCERIVVMYGGRIVEDGPTEQILTAPQHPYTRMLLSSVPARADDLKNERPMMLSSIGGQVE